MLKFKITKASSTMEMSLFEKKDTKDDKGNVISTEIVNKAILELAPAFPDNPKTQPKPGEKRYDYKKKIKISFNPTDMLKAAYHLNMISFGNETEYKKYGDMSKIAGADLVGKKSLSIKSNGKGQAQVYLSQDKDNYVSIYLDSDEAFALAKWFEVTFSKLYNNADAINDYND